MTDTDAFMIVMREVDRHRGHLGDVIDVVTVPTRPGRWRWLATFDAGDVAGYVTADGVSVRNDIADAIRQRVAREHARADARQETRAARQWARARGLTVPDGGPVPAEILAAYRLEGVRA